MIVHSHNLKKCSSGETWFIFVHEEISSKRGKIRLKPNFVNNIIISAELLSLHTYVSEGLGMQERPTFTWAVLAGLVRVSNA